MIIQTSTSSVIDVLSHSQTEVIKALKNELDGEREKTIVVSAIADQHKQTRSVFVGAVRVLEAVGVLQTKSLGMKGLYVKVLNSEALKIIAEG